MSLYFAVKQVRSLFALYLQDEAGLAMPCHASDFCLGEGSAAEGSSRGRRSRAEGSRGSPGGTRVAISTRKRRLLRLSRFCRSFKSTRLTLHMSRAARFCPNTKPYALNLVVRLVSFSHLRTSQDICLACIVRVVSAEV